MALVARCMDVSTAAGRVVHPSKLAFHLIRLEAMHVGRAGVQGMSSHTVRTAPCPVLGSGALFLSIGLGWGCRTLRPHWPSCVGRWQLEAELTNGVATRNPVVASVVGSSRGNRKAPLLPLTEVGGGMRGEGRAPTPTTHPQVCGVCVVSGGRGAGEGKNLSKLVVAIAQRHSTAPVMTDMPYAI